MGYQCKKDGYITIFFSMILLASVSLIMSALESMRISAIRMQTEVACAIACEAFLSQYQPQVQARYGLYLLERDGYDDLFLQQFISENCMQDEAGYASWLSAALESVAISDEITVNEADYEYLLNQISDLMQVVKAEDAWESIIEIVSNVDGDALENQKDNLSYAVYNNGVQAEQEMSKQEPGEDEEVPTEDVVDPRENLTQLLRFPILTLVLESEVSDGILDTSTLSQFVDPEQEIGQINGFMDFRQTSWGLSGNDLNLGNLLEEGSDALFLNYYIVDFLKNASQPEKMSAIDFGERRMEYSKESVLDYEVEYIISGHASNGQNLRNVVNRITLMRMMLNLTYLYGCSAKMSAVRTLSAALAAAMLMPYLEEVLSLLIVAAWAYGEAILDCKTLLGGGKVPLMKDDKTWTLSLNGLSQMSLSSMTSLAQVNGKEQGLSYTDYLHIFLACMPTEKKCIRLLNIIEANVRLEENCSSFMLEQCVLGITINADFKFGSFFGANPTSGGFYEHHVLKSCAY